MVSAGSDPGSYTDDCQTDRKKAPGNSKPMKYEIENDGSSAYRAPAVKRTIEIIALISDSDTGLSLSQIAHSLGYNKSTIYGIIQVLLKEKVLNRSATDKKLFLGPKIVDMSLKSWNYLKIIKKVQPILNELRDLTGETVFLGALSDDRILIMATADAINPIKISAPPGTTMPLFAGGVGRVFLSGSDDADCIALIRKHGLQQFTPETITDEKQYMAALHRAREQGYAVDNGEYMPGVIAIAVGLNNLHGLPLAIWIVSVGTSINAPKIDVFIGEIKRYASLLRASLDE
jgi:DNA-binding IclR family transcriptional regulator